jgi:predicted dehydrogenase
MDRIRTAVIGVGHLGRHHARWYKTIKESKLIGVYDIDQAKCRTVADEWQVRAFDDLSQLAGEVDAVSIAVPTTSHFEVAKQMIEANIHCLIEKPIASTVEEAGALTELSGKHNIILTVGHIERFNPAVQALKEYEIDPRFIEAHRLAAFDPRGTDVAVVLDLMIHDIELGLHLVRSKVKKIEASAVAIVSDSADIANARLTFENGAVANLTASRISLHAMRKMRIFQKSGYFSLDLAEKRADIYRLAESDTESDKGMRIPLGKSGRDIIYSKAGSADVDMLRAELTGFLRAIQAGTAPEVSAGAATEALRLAIEIDHIGVNGVLAGNAS